MEWNGLISQFEQAESNPGLVTLIKGALQQSSLPSPAAKSHLHSRNVIPVNSVQNSYSDTRLEACSLVLSFTYPSKMVRISRFSPADPSVETALQGMFPILNFLWVRDCAPWVGGGGGGRLCHAVKALSWWQGEVTSVPGFPQGSTGLSFFLTC